MILLRTKKGQSCKAIAKDLYKYYQDTTAEDMQKTGSKFYGRSYNRSRKTRIHLRTVYFACY